MAKLLIFWLAMSTIYLPLMIGFWIMVPEGWRYYLGFYPIYLTILSVIAADKGDL